MVILTVRGGDVGDCFGQYEIGVQNTQVYVSVVVRGGGECSKKEVGG